MPDPLVRLDPARLEVAPGGQAQTVLTISNVGSIVEGFRVDVLGDGPAAWVDVSPREVPAYPQQQATVVVTFSPPPGSAAHSGVLPFAVRASSVVDAAASAVAEGDLEVTPVFGLQSRILPVTSSGRWSARHRVELTNWGNAPAKLRLSAGDPDQRLGFLVQPDELDVPPGGTSSARLKVRTRAPMLRGSPVRLPFQVIGDPDAPASPQGPPEVADPRRTVVDAAFNQRPILSRGTVAAATLAAVALVAVSGIALKGRSDEGLDLRSPTPGAPQDLTVKAAGPTTVALTWTPLGTVDTYKIFVARGDAKPDRTVEEDGDLSAKVVDGLDAATTYCFTVRAYRRERPSEASAKRCTTTAKGPAPLNPPPTGSPGTTSPTPETSPSKGGVPGEPTFTSDQWIAIVHLHPEDDPAAALAQDELEALKKRTLPADAGILHSRYFPGLRFQNDSVVVYVGPFATQEEAQSFCTRGVSVCQGGAWQPGPATSPPAAPPSAGTT